jgi:hypothetical protein
MPARNKNKVKRALEKKGFNCETNKDHLVFSFYLNGKRRARTRVSHGSKSKDIDASLISQMATQCDLTTNEFLELVDCTLSQDQYITKLSTKNF